MTQEEIRCALIQNDKASHKALAKLSAELEADEPEAYRDILQRKDWHGEARTAYKAYRRARVCSVIALVLAALVVIASYITGDFGMRLFTGWLNRYALAIGITIAMALFAGSALYLNRRKEILIAYAQLEA